MAKKNRRAPASRPAPKAPAASAPEAPAPEAPAARPVPAAPSFETAVLQQAMAEIAAEAWRYSHAVNKVLKRLDPMEAERFSRQYTYFVNRVDRAMEIAGLRALDLTGQPYSVGLPVQPMNLEDFGEDEPLLVTRTIEPVVLADGRVVKTGVVMVDRFDFPIEEEQRT